MPGALRRLLGRLSFRHPSLPAPVRELLTAQVRRSRRAAGAVEARPTHRVAFEGTSRALGEEVGGRLRCFLPEWEEITEDRFVLSVVREGFCIHLAEPLPRGAIRIRPPLLSPPLQQHVSSEIQQLLEKGAIEQVRDHPLLCLSPVFVIPKRSGKLRMILNMKRINAHIPKERFRMETLATILPELYPSDMTVSIDLKDAYFHIPIHPASRDLLGFAFQGATYRFRALPFGLKPAPRVFTRVVSALAAHLRSQGLRLFTYLDDWLLVANSESVLRSHLSLLLHLTQGLGFIINWDKSELVPTRSPSYLGAVIDIPSQIARPSRDRILAITALARSLRRRPRAQAGQWLRFLGHLASLVDLLSDCRLLMRPFQLHLLKFFRPRLDSRSKRIPLTRDIRRLLIPWSRESFLSRGKPFRTPLPSVSMSTDASLLGWGGHCRGSWISGDWSHLNSIPHINVLELMAVLLSLKHFENLLRGQTVLVLTDNTTVAAYINRQGGTHSRSLNLLTAELWNWCRSHQILPRASYIPGKENLIADFLSRGNSLPSEWALHQEVFDHLRWLWPRLEIDLFATSLNHRLPRFCSRVRDEAAWAIDAFSLHWGNLRSYAFPPFSLIPQVLRKIREDRAWVLLIAPRWPRRPWFPLLLSLVDGHPFPLPDRRDLLIQPLSGIHHQALGALHLTAWPLSGKML